MRRERNEIKSYKNERKMVKRGIVGRRVSKKHFISNKRKAGDQWRKEFQ